MSLSSRSRIIASLITVAATCMLFAVVFAGEARAGQPSTTVVNDDTTGPGPSGADCANADFTSIQAAIDAATAGETILVCAGQYNEGPVSVDKALTITGAGAGESIIDGENEVLGGSAIPGQVDIRATGDVTFSGFTVQNPVRRSTSSQIFGIFAKAPSGTPTYTISDNEIIGANAQNDNGFYTDNSPDTLVFTGNEISGTAGNAMGIEEHPNAATVSGNTLTAGNDPTRTGLTVFPVRVDVENYEISNNTVDANDKFGIRVFAGGTGSATPASATVSDIEISNNTVTNADLAAITLENSATASNGALGEISGATVTGNSLTGDETNGEGVRVSGLVTAPDVSGNAILDFDTGILVQPNNSHEPTGITANQNRIFGNAVGFENTSSEDVNAENNWWGCNEGPNEDGCDGTSNTGSGSIDADPHIVMDIRAAPMRVATGGSSEIIVRFLLDEGDGNVARQFPDGTPIDFSAMRGRVNPQQQETTNGSATTTLTTNSKRKAAIVRADLDAEQVRVRIMIRR